MVCVFNLKSISLVGLLLAFQSSECIEQELVK